MTNAVEVNVTRRAAHGLTLLSNVVWMKTIDNGSSGTEGNAGPPNPFNLNSARGVADFDQALRFTTSVNYPLPRFHVNNVAGAIGQRLAGQCHRHVAKRICRSPSPAAWTTRCPASATTMRFTSRASALRVPQALKNQGVVQSSGIRKNPTPRQGNVQSLATCPATLCAGPATRTLDISLFKDILPEHRDSRPVPGRGFQRLQSHQPCQLPQRRSPRGHSDRSPPPAAARAAST